MNGVVSIYLHAWIFLGIHLSYFIMCTYVCVCVCVCACARVCVLLFLYVSFLLHLSLSLSLSISLHLPPSLSLSFTHSTTFDFRLHSKFKRTYCVIIVALTTQYDQPSTNGVWFVPIHTYAHTQVCSYGCKNNAMFGNQPNLKQIFCT